jgi:Domain of unknown function (DUF4383)
MHTRKFASIGGWVMLVMGVLALVPAFSDTSYVLPALRIDTSYGLFLGFFPMNILNKLVLIGFGIGGILCSRASDVIASVKYSRVVCVAMGLLAVMGLIPPLNTFFGYWPLFRGEVISHAAFAIIGGYYGFVIPARIYKSEMHL